MTESEPGKQPLRTRRRRRPVTPWEEMGRLFEEVLGAQMPSDPSASESGLAPFEGRLPRVNVQDREADVRVTAELPGVSKEDVDVSVAEDTVTIRAQTRKEREEGEPEGDFYRREIATGAFHRTVALPAEVDSDNARATFRDGILELTLPKREQSRSRSIPVE